MKKLVLFLVSILVLSCSTTKLAIDKSLGDEQKDALLTGLTINLNTEDEMGSIVNITEGILAANDLKEFGIVAEENLKSFLSSYGFNQYNNEEIAKREMLPAINIPELGYWVHPETSNYPTLYFTGVAIGFNPKSHINKVKGDDDVDYFIYSDITVSKAYKYGSFGGYPLATFNVAVVDDKGKVVLEAKALGEGKQRFFGVDLSKENMTTALNDAITKLKEL